MGRITRRTRWKELAPSMRLLSNSSAGTLRIAANRKRKLKPIFIHTEMALKESMENLGSLSQLIFVCRSLLMMPIFGLYMILKIMAVTDMDMAMVRENMVS